MKKFAYLAALAVLLSGCADAGGGNMSLGSLMGGGSQQSAGGLAGSLVKSVINNQCVSELQQRKEWRMIALAMSAEKQAEWERKICSCASEEAPNQLSANDLMSLATNRDTVPQTVANITAKTVTACFKRLYR
ncbi:hypothetical protein ACG2K1_04295 [Neisseria sp. 23W00296]|uniref:hypothetical protein n=1 Tax=unclassified Neisseria TaxID=2623750 RepID=UPI0002A43F03|nr:MULTISPECIES: hypothetical protein [unclassified Neisseria]ASP16841.1 hypothetical protein CGZ77_03235 [Neisseria sp. KEM232]EKY06549.1 hypothetical protein HMPREF9120_01423 [Neisseria sp. oral taxon 020 str. F0370]